MNYGYLLKIWKNNTYVEWFRVQRSGLKNPQTAYIKPIHPIRYVGIPDFDQYCEQYLSVVTFEPLAQTWHRKRW